MTIDECIAEWNSKPRRMGCVSASEFLCKRVSGFHPERLSRFTTDGSCYEHVVATNGAIRIDLTPHLDSPNES